MSRLRLLISEATRSIAANLSTTVAATMTVLIGMFLLGTALGLGSWMVSWSNHTKAQLAVNVYFCTPDDGKVGPGRNLNCLKGQRTNRQIDAVRTRLLDLQKQGMVKDFSFVTKDQAWATMKKKSPELMVGLTSNFLPDSFKITPRRAEDNARLAKLLRDPLMPGVEKVDSGKKEVERQVLRVAKWIEGTFTAMVLVLLVASAALIQNTIRLSIFSRRREVEVMKLVGATNWFVRGPFMIEGLIVGAGGTIVAIILLLLSRALVLPRVLPHLNTTSDVHAWPFALTAALLLAAGIGIGVLGSGVSLRRYLQV
ncbi:MAG: cell division protein FtsX [Gaiellaceae bacterium]